MVGDVLRVGREIGEVMKVGLISEDFRGDKGRVKQAGS